MKSCHVHPNELMLRNSNEIAHLLSQYKENSVLTALKTF